jgi:hypothetical protein
MSSNVFRYSLPYVKDEAIHSFIGSSREKSEVTQIIEEWNSRTCMSDLFKQWRKIRPKNTNFNLLFLLYNVNSLNSHTADIDIILNKYAPQICLLNEIGKVALKKTINFPDHHLLVQEGTNSFGGVAILIHQSIKYKEIKRDKNFLLVEIESNPEPVLVGAVYVPPGTTPPFHLFTECRNKPFFIFGDSNAKHTDWGCLGDGPRRDRGTVAHEFFLFLFFLYAFERSSFETNNPKFLAHLDVL